jgi:hypothetical protein
LVGRNQWNRNDIGFPSQIVCIAPRYNYISD